MTRTLICLARHGETNWNLERRFQGQLDIALNYKGRSQARALARELGGVHFDHVYSSDLRRAVATAAPHAEARGLKIHERPDLREKHDGLWHGLTHRTSRRAIGKNTSIISPAGPITPLPAARA